jgi:hypothetical protein
MLLLPDGSTFAAGRARFADSLPGGGEETSKIYVKIEPQALGDLIIAQVDTGAAWSVFHREVAEAMNLLDDEGAPVRLRTRFGPLTGRLQRLLVTIVADDGESLDVEATVWVSPEWPAGNFIGYSGLLERMRFGVDPASNFFYFGSV